MSLIDIPEWFDIEEAARSAVGVGLLWAVIGVVTVPVTGSLSRVVAVVGLVVMSVALVIIGGHTGEDDG